MDNLKRFDDAITNLENTIKQSNAHKLKILKQLQQENTELKAMLKQIEQIYRKSRDENMYMSADYFYDNVQPLIPKIEKLCNTQ